MLAYLQAESERIFAEESLSFRMEDYGSLCQVNLHTIMEEMYKKRISALARARYTVRCTRDDRIPCPIDEGLYLGSLAAANNLNVLKSLKITHILTVANLEPTIYPDEFVYKSVKVSDRGVVNIFQHFEECFEYIEEATRAGGCVLVHCFLGRSRSATIVIAYLMKKNGISASEALEIVRSKRLVVAPNYGFMQQLNNYEQTLKTRENIGMARDV